MKALHSYIIQRQAGDCKVCGTSNTLVAGACPSCAPKISVEDWTKHSKKVYETANPKNYWFVYDEISQFIDKGQSAHRQIVDTIQYAIMHDTSGNLENLANQLEAIFDEQIQQLVTEIKDLNNLNQVYKDRIISAAKALSAKSLTTL